MAIACLLCVLIFFASSLRDDPLPTAAVDAPVLLAPSDTSDLINNDSEVATLHVHDNDENVTDKAEDYVESDLSVLNLDCKNAYIRNEHGSVSHETNLLLDSNLCEKTLSY